MSKYINMNYKWLNKLINHQIHWTNKININFCVEYCPCKKMLKNAWHSYTQKKTLLLMRQISECKCNRCIKIIKMNFLCRIWVPFGASDTESCFAYLGEKNGNRKCIQDCHGELIKLLLLKILESAVIITISQSDITIFSFW